MLPVEMVVRDYLTGSTETSIWPMYRDGRRAMYGLHLPDGLRKNDKLPRHRHHAHDQGRGRQP